MTTYEQLIQQGEKRGIQKGEQIGIQKKTVEVVFQAYQKGLDLEFISEITNLSVDQVENILGSQLDEKYNR